MDPSQSENLLKIPGKKIFQSSFSLKTTLPDPFPGPILTIPPSDLDRLHRPSINGLDLSNTPSLYIPKNMYLPLKKLYKLFELEPFRKESDKGEGNINGKEKWFINEEKPREKNLGLFKELEWTEEDELILMHSGKKTLKQIQKHNIVNQIKRNQNRKINIEPTIKKKTLEKVYYLKESRMIYRIIKDYRTRY